MVNQDHNTGHTMILPMISTCSSDHSPMGLLHQDPVWGVLVSVRRRDEAGRGESTPEWESQCPSGRNHGRDFGRFGRP